MSVLLTREWSQISRKRKILHYHDYLVLLCITALTKALCPVMGTDDVGYYVPSPYHSAALRRIQDTAVLIVLVQLELQDQFQEH
jgi:hypothetical protein